MDDGHASGSRRFPWARVALGLLLGALVGGLLLWLTGLAARRLPEGWLGPAGDPAAGGSPRPASEATPVPGERLPAAERDAAVGVGPALVALRDARGEPVSGARVRLAVPHAAGASAADAAAEAAGWVELPELGPGRFELPTHGPVAVRVEAPEGRLGGLYRLPGHPGPNPVRVPRAVDLELVVEDADGAPRPLRASSLAPGDVQVVPVRRGRLGPWAEAERVLDELRDLRLEQLRFEQAHAGGDPDALAAFLAGTAPEALAGLRVEPYGAAVDCGWGPLELDAVEGRAWLRGLPAEVPLALHLRSPRLAWSGQDRWVRTSPPIVPRPGGPPVRVRELRGRVTGRVAVPDDEPVGSVPLQVLRVVEGPGFRAAEAVTGIRVLRADDFNFELLGLPPGEYQLEASWRVGDRLVLAGRTVCVESDWTDAGELVPGPRSVRFETRVRTSSGDPLPFGLDGHLQIYRSGVDRDERLERGARDPGSHGALVPVRSDRPVVVEGLGVGTWNWTLWYEDSYVRPDEATSLEDLARRRLDVVDGHAEGRLRDADWPEGPVRVEVVADPPPGGTLPPFEPDDEGGEEDDER